MTNNVSFLLLVMAMLAHGAQTTPKPFRGDRLSLNGTWKFELRRDNPLTGTGPVRFGPVSASSQALLIEPWQGESYNNEGRWRTAVPWAVSATILDSDTSAAQIWKPHPAQKGETWWRLDLGHKQSVGSIRIHWAKPWRVEVMAETSNDGTQWSAWTKLASAPGDTVTAISAAAVQARYVRLNFSPTQFDGTRRIEVYTSGLGGQLSRWEPRVQRGWYDELRKFTPADGFQLASFDDANWKTIQVPGYWEVQRFSEPTWWQPDETVGYYRRTFQVPENWRGHHIRLRFEGVNNGAQIWINGHEIGYHESGFTAFEYDVTPHLRFGNDNIIAVRAAKWTLTHDYDTDDMWFLGGIWRDTYLYSLPASRIDDYWVRTEFDAQYRDAVLRVKASLQTQEASRPQACTLEGTLYDSAGRAVPLDGFSAQFTLAGRAPLPVELASLVKAPQKWTAETPSLYSLVVRLAVDGRIAQEVRTTVGFRQVEVKGNALQLNGVPLKIRGVVTTRANPNDAGESSEKIFAREIRLLKEANVNAIRSHTTPLEEDFLDLCDRHGIYVIPDVPDVWVNEYDFRYLTEGNILRARETFEQHKNRPSVIAWHIGNENGMSSAFLGMGRAAVWLRENDNTRPVMICSNRADPAEFGTEIHDLHYRPMTYEEFRNPTTAPVVFGEFHAVPERVGRLKDRGFVETWGRSLKLEWSEFEKRDWSAGGLICCWDDGSVNGNIGPRQWGMIDGKRQPKDVLHHVRKVFAPVRIALEKPTFKASQFEATAVVANNYSFTDLAGYGFRWKLLKARKEIKSGEQNWRVKPGKNGRFPLALTGAAGADTLEITVSDPEGYSIQHESFSLPVAAAPANLEQLLKSVDIVRSGPIRVRPDPKQVRTAAYSALVRAPGKFQLTDAGGRNVVAIEGVVLNKRKSSESYQPVGAIEYGTVEPHANGWSVPVSVVGKADGSMRLEFGPDWLRVSYDLKAAETLAIREAGLKLAIAPRLSRMAWNREALWNTNPVGWADGPVEQVPVGEFSQSLSRRNVLWISWTGDRSGSVLAVPSGATGNVRSAGEAGTFVLSDFLSAGEFLGKFDRETVERQVEKGQHLTGGFTLHFLDPQQAAKLERLPTPQKDITWVHRAR